MQIIKYNFVQEGLSGKIEAKTRKIKFYNIFE